MGRTRGHTISCSAIRRARRAGSPLRSRIAVTIVPSMSNANSSASASARGADLHEQAVHIGRDLAFMVGGESVGLAVGFAGLRHGIDERAAAEAVIFRPLGQRVEDGERAAAMGFDPRLQPCSPVFVTPLEDRGHQIVLPREMPVERGAAHAGDGQRGELTAVVGIAARDDQGEGTAQGVTGQMNLAGQPVSGTGPGPPPPFRAPAACWWARTPSYA